MNLRQPWLLPGGHPGTAINGTSVSRFPAKEWLTHDEEAIQMTLKSQMP